MKLNESTHYLEQRLNRISEHCYKCQGKFNDDCKGCNYLTIRNDLIEQINQMKTK